jgi:hypothetical protein
VKLERALLFTFVLHALAMLAMAGLLLPGMPGGGGIDDGARIQYIAGHPWLWRLGWLPWQLTAVSDLWLALALLRTAEIRRLPAVLTAVVTVAAVIPDQLGQACWITRGISLAGTDPVAYLAYEREIFTWTAAWGATLYTVAALGWTWCFAGARLWSRWLTALSLVLWPLFFAISLGPLGGMNPKLVAAGNALGFVALELWLALVLEEVLRRARPATVVGRWAPWRHPRWRWLDGLGESRFLRALGEWLPSIPLRSDLRDVLYVNYLVEAERLAPLVPAGLELDRLGPEGRHAIFTFLSFRHGGFGPAFLGPLRRLCPSPIQSNWRVHVRDPRSGLRGVFFTSTALTSTPHALLARWMAEGVPMHVLASAELREDEGRYRLVLDPGTGSAPDVAATFTPAPVPADGPWSPAFPTWNDLLAYVVPQDRVLCTQPGRAGLRRLEIALGIPLTACEPLAGDVHSRAASAIAGAAVPFAFRVPRVSFHFRGEAPVPRHGQS